MSTPTTTPDMARLDELFKQTTQGVWVHTPAGYKAYVECNRDTLAVMFGSREYNGDNNARWIAESRNAYPTLSKRLRDLEAFVQSARAASGFLDLTDAVNALHEALQRLDQRGGA